MAVAALVIASTPYRISFQVAYDGVAGTGVALTLTAAQLAAAAQPGMFRDFLATQWAGNNQANARLRLLGQGAAAALGNMGTAIQGSDHCRCFVRDNFGLVPEPPTVDADVDGVDPLQNELNFGTGGLVEFTCILDVEYQHTLTR